VKKLAAKYAIPERKSPVLVLEAGEEIIQKDNYSPYSELGRLSHVLNMIRRGRFSD
jgi:hypothetical protein